MGTTEKPQWQQALERKHGKPLEDIEGWVYTLCYSPPVVVLSVSSDYPVEVDPTCRFYQSSRPIRHYVGWTQQKDPGRRIANHHPAGTPVTVTRRFGLTMRDEERVKRTGTCPTCGGRFTDSLARTR